MIWLVFPSSSYAATGTGLGVPPVTGEGMLKNLFKAYNSPRSSYDLVRLEEEKKEHGGTLPDKYVLKRGGGRLPDRLGDDAM